jgi:energy-coupling factor transporter ATP-binding protein EcfA2
VEVPRNLILKTEEYLNNRFPKREPYSKGVSAVLASAIAGNSIRTARNCPIQTKGNIYVLLCGRSGTGKSTIVNYGMELIERAQFTNILTDDTTTESLAGYFNAHNYALMRMDEFTKVIGSYRKKAYMSGLREALVKAYDGTPLIQVRSTRQVAEAKNYSLAGIADTQPRTISEEVGESDIQSGFLPRFNWFHLTNPEVVKPRTVSKNILDIQDELTKQYRALLSTALHNEIHFIFQDNDIRQIFDRLSPYQESEFIHLQPFYERVTLFAYKYAMLYHFTESSFLDNFEIKDNDEEWTTDQSTLYNKHVTEIDISPAAVSWSIEFLQDLIEKHMPETFKILKLNDSDKIVDAIERYQDRHKAPMPESLLYRSVVHTLKDSRIIHNAIELAQKQDLIQIHRVQGGVSWSLYNSFNDKKVEEYKNDEEDDEESDT